ALTGQDCLQGNALRHLSFHGRPGEQQRAILAMPPRLQKIIVMRTARMSRLTRRQDELPLVPVADVEQLTVGYRESGRGIWTPRINPALGNGVGVAADGKWAATEA